MILNFGPAISVMTGPTYSEMTGPVKSVLDSWSESVLNLALRIEYADYNVGNFQELGLKIADHMYAIVPAISFRPSSQTVIRANYRYERHTDLLRNPASQTAGFQFGFSTYF